MNLTNTCLLWSCVLLTFLLTVNSGVAQIDEATVVGAWLLDGNANDASPNRLNGEIIGDPEWVNDARFGNSMRPNGAYIVIPQSEITDLTEQVTITAWVKLSEYVNDPRILDKGLNEAPWSVYSIYLTGDGESNLKFRGSAKDVVGDSDVPLNKWIHLAATYDGSETNIYIDGELENSGDFEGELTTTENPIHIAAYQFGNPIGVDRAYTGLLDELILFNVALSQEDIRALMNNGFSGVLAVSSAGKLTTTWGNLKSY